MVNFIPIGDIWSWNEDLLCIPKKLWLRREQRYMTFREILDSEVHLTYHTEEYDRLGIDVVENTSEEIFAVTIEMDERLNGRWHTSQEDEELQSQFWLMHKSAYPSVAIKSRIGAEFLRENRVLVRL